MPKRNTFEAVLRSLPRPSLDGVIRAVTRGIASPSVRKHLGLVAGLEHLPPTGPLVVVANHRSYYDHFVLSLVLGIVRTAPTWFLTKSEAFDRRLSRAFHRAWRGIPVTRSNVNVSAIRNSTEVLKRGDTLVIYPEGTRGPGYGLLPFKAGAFMIGLLSGAPVVPIGMVGTNTVLPKGHILPSAGRIVVQIGPRLSIPPAGKEPERLQAMAEEAARAIDGLVTLAGSANVWSPRPPPFDVAGALDARLARSLDRDGHLPKSEVFTLKEIARCALPDMRDETEILIQQARLDGLQAEHDTAVMQVARALRVRRACERILSRDPKHMMANYMMGRWHLKAPSLLGGDKLRAIDYLRTAAQTAASGDTRARTALADAWLANGLPPNARRELERVLVETDKDHPRYAIRIERTQNLITKLSATETRASAQ